ncbi:MAG: hypothetical protein IT431_09980 [Phycisphaerales bacterium]|nr:hypothetical protein [Phycisphaerales bacterium]
MRARPAHPRRPTAPGGRCALIAAVWGVLGAGSAIGQADAAGVDGNTQADPRAAFRWQIGSPADAGAPEPSDTAGSWTLDAGPEIRLATEAGAPDAQLESDAWMLASWTPGAGFAGPLDAAFAFDRGTSALPTAGRADRWARSVFSNEASLRTPLTPGQEVFGWELADGLTLSGVGSRRVITDRDRGFVLSAEAGIRLTPRAGFQVGYELLQTPAGASSEGLGGESVFARFQLRF